MKIPIDKVDGGISLCLENAQQFCSDAEVLAKQGSCETALGLCILATEELGKALMLKDRISNARKKSEEIVVFKREKPEMIFTATNSEDLKRIGFTGKEINPFFDHLSKLLYAKNMLSLASYERSMLSLEGKWFQTIDEMMKKANKLRKQTQEVNIDLRNLVFYVDYDEKQGTWKKRVDKIKIEKMQGLILDIQRSIRLIAS